MSGRPSAEGATQQEVVLVVRAAIDTAIAYPTAANDRNAVKVAMAYPKALRSVHVRDHLGQTRWDWLHKHGVFPVMEQTEIADLDAVKATITPTIRKVGP